ncbi:MAG TPA: hypothetical protein VGF75_04300, partial [Candidatus Saccharimonadales bacterium]
LLILAAYVVYNHVHTNTVKTTGLSNYSFNENFTCTTGTASVINAQVNSFISSYQKHQYGSLFVYSYGASPPDAMEAGSITCHRLVTRGGVIYDSEYSYADASPNSLLTIATCKLSYLLDTKSLATVTANCSDAINPIHMEISEAFNLDGSITP